MLVYSANTDVCVRPPHALTRFHNRSNAVRALQSPISPQINFVRGPKTLGYFPELPPGLDEIRLVSWDWPTKCFPSQRGCPSHWLKSPVGRKLTKRSGMTQIPLSQAHRSSPATLPSLSSPRTNWVLCFVHLPAPVMLTLLRAMPSFRSSSQIKGQSWNHLEGLVA